MNKLDEFFKEKLTEHSITPPIALWDKVESGLSKKNDTWMWLRWAAVFLFGVLALGTFLIRQNETSATLSVKEKVIERNNKQEQTIPPVVKNEQLSSTNITSNERKKNKVHIQSARPKSAVVNNKQTIAHATFEHETSSTIIQAETSAAIENSTNENAVNKSIVLTYTLETVEQPIEESSAVDSSNDKKESSLKKVVRFASEVKNGDSPLSGLRVMKEDLFALDLKKKATGKKQ